jgi:hypothetical protein
MVAFFLSAFANRFTITGRLDLAAYSSERASYRQDAS